MPTLLGHALRSHFLFSEAYTPLNQGSYGAHPTEVQRALEHYHSLSNATPDTYFRYIFPALLDKSRAAVAELVQAPVEEVVFVQNATVGINTVLRSMKGDEGDVIVYFETVYGSTEKTADYVCEMTVAENEKILVEYPVEDDDLIKVFRSKVKEIEEKSQGKQRVRMAVFDTICSMPGVRVPWERLVSVCRELGVLSCVDGAHGVGHIPLRLGTVRPDFFVSNCHKWLYVPRGCAVFYVPMENQHLIRSSVPTSHGFQPLPRDGKDPINNPLPSSEKSPFVELFEFVGTASYEPYLCVPDAIRFRSEVCGGEEKIMEYCNKVAQEGGQRAAEVLGTEVMDNAKNTLTNCAMVNVRLPLQFGSKHGEIKREDALAIWNWLLKEQTDTYNTYIPVIVYRDRWWARFSGQVYLEVQDLVWGAEVLKKLCQQIRKGEPLREKPRL